MQTCQGDQEIQDVEMEDDSNEYFYEGSTVHCCHAIQSAALMYCTMPRSERQTEQRFVVIIITFVCSNGMF